MAALAIAADLLLLMVEKMIQPSGLFGVVAWI
jgi:hypothetical protein